MRIVCSQRRQGIALIIVLMVIAILAVLAGNFAATMKVETMLARNSSFDSEFEWLARSGVEAAKAILAQETANYAALNQKWAGGSFGSNSNSPFAEFDLHHFPIGDSGKFISIDIVDQERYFNINSIKRMVDQGQRTQAGGILDNILNNVIGVDASQAIAIRDSIIDWLDADDAASPSGAETSTYKGHAWLPHICKDGAIDDLSELLLVHGVTEQPQVYSRAYADPGASVISKNNRMGASKFEQVAYETTLTDLLTTFPTAGININTADAKVLQCIPGVSEDLANRIIAERVGPDRIPNTDDDGYRSTNIPLPELAPAMPMLQPFITVNSLFFKVNVKVELGGMTRTYHAIIQKKSPRDIQMLAMDWD